MLDNNTISKLRDMKMGVMAKVFANQLGDNTFSQLSFEERIGLMVDAEWTSRQNNRLMRLIRGAGFSTPEACIEDIEYHPDRQLDKALITRLSTCNFVEERHNIIILGASGGGKSYLANAFGVAAARKLYSVRYIRLPD
jgi:DNA replication protein DnaC